MQDAPATDLDRQAREMHSGTFGLESTPGVGATVTVILPAERVVERPRGVGAEQDRALAV